MTSGIRLLACLLVACGASVAQTQGGARTSSPLPGKGLAEHDFLYAGESHERRIFLVRQGKVVWSYDDPTGKGEVSDAVILSNGNVLFAHQFGVTEITPGKKVVWNYDTAAGHEVHTAMPIGKDRVLYIQNGNPAVLRVVNIVTNVTEHEVTLQTRHPDSTHGQFRHARLTDRGTLMVAHMDSNKVVEYDYDGKELWSFPATVPWGVTPLSNGNVLITDKEGVREVTQRGDIPWSFRPSDTAAYEFTSLQQAWRLPNGNTVINNWINEWTKTPENEPGSVQAIELTPAKQVVWVLQSWSPPVDLGPATTIQFLGVGPALEDAHFGPIH
ncbi:outer membrane protein assembly factor BamB [Granulicella aggregans]|uniref:Outer membrane protein assembly factor BamB n=1 Tax=Granulicella aggregans TaxID=474949 RepID=A0A7W7ZIM6_9BACT|nr:PQQ-binding-like beta-propeller repeat protein [Granulicella aggregans]MBB5060433.1 outer membrane protein assembly factor BamB [Granulicella aggregans]